MNEQKQRNFIFLLFMLVLLGLFFMQLLDFGPSNTQDRGWARLPVSIRANSQADYSRDSGALIVQPVRESILEQIILDLEGTGNPQDRLSTLQVSLSMPVPTMTLNPQMPTSTMPPFTSTSGVPGTTTPQATASLPMTGTVVTSTPTGTLVSTSTLTPTATPVPPATKKAKPTSRPRPTRRP